MSEWHRLKKSGATDKIIFNLMNKYDKYRDFIQSINEDTNPQLKIIAEKSEKTEIEDDFEQLEKRKIKLIDMNSEEYPEILKNISNPPIFLYIKGKGVFREKSIGVVGTRKMSAVGKSGVEKIVKELVEQGVTIVSGLAEGVDGAAHEKTLNLGGYTVAVIGTGHDVIFPEINRKIWERIATEGTIVSEYPPGTPGFKWNFPQRNRIIAGLSKGVLVAESYKNGGSLITAKIALEENREVFAIPGGISYPSFEGCNDLIKHGEAKLVTSGSDILEEFTWESKQNIDNLEIAVMNESEKKIYKALNFEKNLDELILETKFNGSELLSFLTMMEINGLVKSVSGGRYKRNL